MDSNLKLPIVFEYLDVFVFLKDYYAYRKAMNKSFSYQTWSDELAFNSRSFLRMMITGKKKITPKFVSAFAQQCFSKKAEEQYFVHLVKYSQSSSTREKQNLSQQLLKILKHENSQQVIAKGEAFVSDPLLPRLVSLLSFKDFRATTAYCAKILRLEEDVVESALQKLKEMELVENIFSEGQLRWYSQSAIFKVPDSFGSFDFMKFHEISLREAISAFHQPKELRRYKSLFLPMDDEDLKDFNRLLDAFAQEQMIRFNSKTCEGKRMFQCNFNVHSFTEMIEKQKAL